MEFTLSNLRSDYKLIYKVQPQTALRIAALIEYIKIDIQYMRPEFKAGKRMKQLALCRGLDISIRTLFRWRRAYISGGFVALTYKKAVGKKAKDLTKIEKFLIEDMRKKYRWGAEVIQAHLKRDEYVELSKYRIERYLTMSGLRDKYPCTTKKRKLKKRKEHTRIVKIYHPGEHTQMDTKHQPHILKNGKKCYVFNFIDHASNWSYKRAYSKICPESTIDFMKRLIKICPFKIQSIQTDNGTEYTYRFYKQYVDIKKEHPLEVFCKKHNINQRLIPPGVKELNGLVERSHRQDDQELFSRVEPDEIDEFNSYLEEYYKERNEGRRFKKNDWSTPNEWLKDYKNTQLALECGHHYKFRKRDESLLPKLKIVEMSKPSKQMTDEKSANEINNCKDSKKNDEKIKIKRAA